MTRESFQPSPKSHQNLSFSVFGRIYFKTTIFLLHNVFELEYYNPLMADKIRIGIIGTGFGAKVHAPAMIYHDNFEVVAIAGRNPEKTEKIAKDLEIPHFYTDWRTMLKDETFDAVSVSTPPYLHFTMAKAVLENNFHLLLEKPTTETALEAKKLVRLAEENSLVGMMCHEFRYLPHFHFSHDLINQGKIGTIREIYMQTFFGSFSNVSRLQGHWLLDSKYEGGMLGAIGSHMIDRIRFLTGKEFKEVAGRVTRKIQIPGFSSDDGFSAVLKMEDEIIVNMAVSATVSPPPPSTLIIGGSEGTLLISNRDVMFAGSEDQTYDKLDIPTSYSMDMNLAEKDQRIPPFLKLLDRFANAIETGEMKTPSLHDGWLNQVTLDGIKSSQKTNNFIKLDSSLF
ncbi:MAG: gfo/Idh/MocA family oxidoreductase [Methanobacteriota archaeon]|nr:MAG: gfo/Idh/MocA family oxidoreductase [Euryarchaeota archaeon]